MNDKPLVYDAPFVNSIFHPTDFTEASADAFFHALAIALIRKTQFTILHAGASNITWDQFPRVRKTLVRWGLLEDGSDKRDVYDKLDVTVKKIKTRDDHPRRATLDYLDRHPTDLLVLAAGSDPGFRGWFQSSGAEHAAKQTRTKTLFVRAGCKGFVDTETGHIDIARVLIPIDTSPSPVAAVEYAMRVGRLVSRPIQVDLLFVGPEGERPALDLLDDTQWTWNAINRKGNVVDEIVSAAKELDSDLLIMPTEGRQGVLDVLRGTTTEQVLRHSPCPLMAVPQ